jgi:competence protein ComEA
MPTGARIADAIESARGPKTVADLDALNLAEPLADGQKVDVPRRGEDAVVTAPGPPPASPGAPSSGTSPGATVDLNSADQATLETIPDVGPVTAQAIIAYRTEVGAFDSIEQLLEVSGIGPATLETMRPYVTV